MAYIHSLSRHLLYKVDQYQVLRQGGYVVITPFLTTFGHLLFSGSGSLARVTPLFLAVTGFRAVQLSRYQYVKGWL